MHQDARKLVAPSANSPSAPSFLMNSSRKSTMISRPQVNGGLQTNIVVDVFACKIKAQARHVLQVVVRRLAESTPWRMPASMRSFRSDFTTRLIWADVGISLADIVNAETIAVTEVKLPRDECHVFQKGVPLALLLLIFSEHGDVRGSQSPIRQRGVRSSD